MSQEAGGDSASISPLLVVCCADLQLKLVQGSLAQPQIEAQ